MERIPVPPAAKGSWEMLLHENDDTGGNKLVIFDDIVGESFDSGNMAPGKTLQLTLQTPGTYQCDCTLHPTWMKGTITVLAKLYSRVQKNLLKH